MTSATEHVSMISVPRLRQGTDVSENCFKEVRKRPAEKPSRWGRAIRGVTIAVMQDRPPLIAPLGHPPMLVRHV
jgi:hypothetical protein